MLINHADFSVYRIEELENLVISLKREKAYLEERVLELTKKW